MQQEIIIIDQLKNRSFNWQLELRTHKWFLEEDYSYE